MQDLELQKHSRIYGFEENMVLVFQKKQQKEKRSVKKELHLSNKILSSWLSLFLL